MRRIDFVNKQLAKAGIAFMPHMVGLPSIEEQDEFIKWRDQEVDENGNPITSIISKEQRTKPK